MNTTTSMSAVTPFCFNDHLIRTVAIESDPWFVAKDVCQVLELDDTRKAVIGLDDDEKGRSKVPTPGGEQEMLIISESGLYTLIIRSNKPQAKPFRKWVTAEVLPQIRRTGSYQMAGDTADRTVQVNHTHLRGTIPQGVLDIRYTLDLSKIILHPSKRSVAMLERITGIVLADIMNEHPTADRLEENFREFFNSTYTRDADKSLTFASLYREYLAWCRNIDVKAFEVATRRRFGDLVRAAGFGVKISGGTCRVYDISKISVEVLA